MPALLWALALGILADALVRPPGRPGLNVAIWSLAGVAVLVVLLRRRADPATGEMWWLVAGALGFSGALVLRDADALAVFNLVAAVALLMMAAGRATASWARHAQMSDAAFAVLRVTVLSAAGPLGWGHGDPNAARGTMRDGRGRRERSDEAQPWRCRRCWC